MIETKKLVSVLAAGVLVAAAAGLTACGTSNTTNTSNTDNTANTVNANDTDNANVNETENVNANETENTDANENASDTKSDEIVALRGALSDGAILTYIENDEGTKAALSIEPEKSKGGEVKTWIGTVKVGDDGKVTVTDEESKKEVNFILTGLDADGCVEIDMSPDGYGTGLLVPLTEDDCERLMAAELLAEAFDAPNNSIGAFEDGTLIFYAEDAKGEEGVVAVLPKDKEIKIWSGKLTTDEKTGEETVTDEESGETFVYTWTKNEDGTLGIQNKDYGEGQGIEMGLGDWNLSDALMSELLGE